MNKQIVFIGGGNMAQAIIARMVTASWKGEQIHVVDRNPDKLQRLQEYYRVQTHNSFGPWIGECDIVVLAVKPQQLSEVIRQIHSWLIQALVISIAAGFKVETLEKLTETSRIVRCMPNTPIQIGEGVCGLFASKGASNSKDHELVNRVFSSCGDLFWCDEEEMLEGITAVSGSGPAYVFHFIEALEEAGRRYGFNKVQATRLAIATVLGAAQLAKSSTDSPATLRERVTSKGGTTYEALKVMDENNFIPMMQKAMDACKKRSRELGEIFSK